MERLKPVAEFLEPDARMSYFGTTLEWDHEQLDELRLLDSVAEDVRSYFETIKNLYLYGRLVYSFYSVAHFQTFSFMELALRSALDVSPYDRSKTFRPLLKQAIKTGLVQEDGFSHVRHIREAQAEHETMMQELGYSTPAMPQTGQYLQVLIESLPKLRNSYAHPKFLSIVTPGIALDSIRFAAEFVNQLFSRRTEHQT